MKELTQAELAKKDLFDKAQKSILLLMQTDSLTSFFKSPLYKRHLKAKEAEGKQRLLQEEKEKMSEWMKGITQQDELGCDCSNLFVWCCCCCYWCCMPSYEP